MHIYTSPTLSGIHRVESWPIAFSTYILHQLVSAGSLCASAMCVCARERLGVLASCFNGAKEVCHGCVCKRCCQPKYFSLHALSPHRPYTRYDAGCSRVCKYMYETHCTAAQLHGASIYRRLMIEAAPSYISRAPNGREANSKS